MAWLEEHYIHLLKTSLANELGEEGRLEYSVIIDQGNPSTKPMAMKLPTSHPKGRHQELQNGQEGVSSPFHIPILDEECPRVPAQ